MTLNSNLLTFFLLSLSLLTQTSFAKATHKKARLYKFNVELGRCMTLDGYSGFNERAVGECSDLTQTVLSKGQIKIKLEGNGVTLKASNLEGADLSNVHFKDADLSFAHLKGAQLRNTVLEKVNFMGADLRGTDFTSAKFLGPQGKKYQLKGAFFNLKTVLRDSTYPNTQTFAFAQNMIRFIKNPHKGAQFELSGGLLRALKWENTKQDGFIIVDLLSPARKAIKFRVDNYSLFEQACAISKRAKVKVGVNQDQLVYIDEID